jgi:mannan endo-1,4-beta-mannosidase
VISEARKYGVKLILGFVNNWSDLGGKPKYVEWARERGQNVKSEDDFFTHPVVKQYYKNHVKVSFLYEKCCFSRQVVSRNRHE